jgi:hypothetical protein
MDFKTIIVHNPAGVNYNPATCYSLGIVSLQPAAISPALSK